MPRPPHPGIPRTKVIRVVNHGNRLFAAMERQNVVAMANVTRVPTGFVVRALHGANAAVDKARREWLAACEDALSGGV